MPEETIASLLGDPTGIVERWQSLVEQRPVVGVAGVDAHAKLALWDVEPGDNRFTLPFPGYEATFRTLSVHVRPERPLSGDACHGWRDDPEGDSRRPPVHGHRRHRHAGVFRVQRQQQRDDGSQGGTLTADEPVRLHVRSNAPPEFTTTVW